MIVTYKPKTIAEIMAGMSDQELIDVLPWIRNEDGERMSLIELRHYLREHLKKEDNNEPQRRPDKAGEV